MAVENLRYLVGDNPIVFLTFSYGLSRVFRLVSRVFLGFCRGFVRFCIGFVVVL